MVIYTFLKSHKHTDGTAESVGIEHDRDSTDSDKMSNSENCSNKYDMNELSQPDNDLDEIEAKKNIRKRTRTKTDTENANT